MKAFGAYHGHHDAVLVSVGDDDGGQDRRFCLHSCGGGHPGRRRGPHGGCALQRRRRDGRATGRTGRRGRPAACVILEPIFQMGVLVPEPGYLEAVREMTRAHGALLLFDEVKSGFAVGPGGFTAQCGVEPDVVTVGKALGGGLPVAAVGRFTGDHGAGRDPAGLPGRHVQRQRALHGRGAREPRADPALPTRTRRLGALGSRLLDGCRDVLRRAGRGGHGARAGARGFVALTAEPAADHRGVRRAHPPELGRLAWLYLMNRGMFVTPAWPLQWMVGLGHTEDDVDSYVSVFEELVTELG